MIDVLKACLGRARTSDDDVELIDAGSSVRMVCIPVVDGRARRRLYVDVGLSPGPDWFEVFGHPPYRVVEGSRPPRMADPMVETTGVSSTGEWTVRVAYQDLPTLRAVLRRVAGTDEPAIT